MLAGNGKNFLYDTAHVPVASHLADVDMDTEDGDEEADFLQAVEHYAENKHLRLQVSAATDLRRGTRKAIRAKAEAYIKTVRHCPAPERCWLSSSFLTVLLVVIAAGQDS